MLIAKKIKDIWERYPSSIITVVLVFFALLFFIIAVGSVQHDSATDDEPAHIVAGYIKLKYGYFDFYNEQPPLINSLSAFPLLFTNVHLDSVWQTDKNHWGVGHQFLYTSGNNPDDILFLARIPIILLYILLCFMVYLFIVDITKSRITGLFGFLLTGFCPTLLAHGRLATVDMGVTLFMFVAVYLFLRFLYKPTYWHAVMTGLITGLALLSKISALFLFGYFAIIFVFYLFYERLNIKQIMQLCLKGLVMTGMMLLTIWMVYFLEMKYSYVQMAYPSVRNNLFQYLMIPFREYFKQIQSVYRWVMHPYDKPQFLLGQFSFVGWWYYYPVVFFLKTTLAALLLACTLGLLCLKKIFFPSAEQGEKNKKTRFTVISIILFLLLFMGISMMSKIDLGVRYILPIYPFFYVLIAIGSYRVVTTSSHIYRRYIIGTILVFLFWHSISSIVSYPGYLGYFNEIIGNNRRADTYVVDSNLDWGQDLRRLTNWVEEHQISKIHIDYFGGGDPSYYLKDKVIPWQSTFQKEKGYYAVSRHFYRTSAFYQDRGTDYDHYFTNDEYLTTIGTSIYVYKVD
jgi:4-amino-4-deoxy-L-arabinose transferase-like glycosyltransferase